MTEEKSARPGRPVDAAKSAAILDAARRLFFAHGVEAVTVEQIAREAGMAKTTVYNKFGGRDDVFQAVLARIGDEVQRDMLDVLRDGAGIRDALRSYGLALLRCVAERKLLTAEPVIAMEALRAPHLGERFFQMGPGRARGDLARAIAAWQADGRLQDDEAPELLAEDLLGLWFGTLIYEMRLRPTMVVRPERLEAKVERGIEQFMRLSATD